MSRPHSSNQEAVDSRLVDPVDTPPLQPEAKRPPVLDEGAVVAAVGQHGVVVKTEPVALASISSRPPTAPVSATRSSQSTPRYSAKATPMSTPKGGRKSGAPKADAAGSKLRELTRGLLACFSNAAAKSGADSVTVKEVTDFLAIPKRRIYDVTNPLEAIGLLRRTRGKLSWTGPPLSSFSFLNVAQDLEQEEERQVFSSSKGFHLLGFKHSIRNKAKHICFTHNPLCPMGSTDRAPFLRVTSLPRPHPALIDATPLSSIGLGDSLWADKAELYIVNNREIDKAPSSIALPEWWVRLNKSVARLGGHLYILLGSRSDPASRDEFQFVVHSLDMGRLPEYQKKVADAKDAPKCSDEEFYNYDYEYVSRHYRPRRVCVCPVCLPPPWTELPKPGILRGHGMDIPFDSLKRTHLVTVGDALFLVCVGDQHTPTRVKEYIPETEQWVGRAKIRHTNCFSGTKAMKRDQYVVASTHNALHILADHRHLWYTPDVLGGKGQWRSEDMPESVGRAGTWAVQ
ncbi:hypothetical protein KIPB_003205 [Kipferlia bialata]|uniref:E2F/DP family winged-helix DNA-binding domain-containing protein n=1 Tax=Kipferlia bialata TaxID=797122 RepID=A0A9K3CU38_9EUKA|nr:hypothetical protein KIPB_003205 [Kipferlia bialata]|eukprot:g3205.t1